ncbi:hypothetical protein [Scytonema sp. PCC 10023]|uniref:hypothetical protein n=1 Tax=Scytonema sp. PCC 10023 TaxID=1680591 RepID=UPI0039C5CEDF
MKEKFHYRLNLFLLWVPITILLNSCGSDFKSVENFVNEHQTNIKNYSDTLAQDIYESCLRRTHYIILTTLEGPDIREDTLEGCNTDNKPNVSRVKDANDLLLQYMKRLGQVASGRTVSFNENIDNLQTALVNLKVGTFVFPKPTVEAGTSIFRILVNTFSKEKRGRGLKKAILCGNESLQAYITGNPTFDEKQPPSEGLIKLAQDGYIEGILEIEKSQINSYYKTYFSNIRQSNGLPISTALEVEKDYNKAMEIVQEKNDNAQNYISVLQATAQAHNQLKNEFLGKGENAIGQEEVKELCQSVFAGRESDLEKSKQNTKLDINEQQMRKAQEILSHYSQKLKILQNDLEKESDIKI